jgi:membrane protease YdiL (CAAX protease family)
MGVRYTIALSSARQIGWLPALGLWAAICFASALYASWQGFGGRAFAVTLFVFSFYLGAALLLAARGVAERVVAKSGTGAGFLLGFAVLLAYLIYALDTNSFVLWHAAAAGAFVLVPLALASSASAGGPGAWQDYASLAVIWVGVKFFLPQWLWPYPGGRPSHVLTILLGLNVGLACFLLARKVSGTGYSLGWGRHWGFLILLSFGLFALIAVPLGTAIHFIRFAPRYGELATLPVTALGMLLFTAWPEEFFFRGLLQNLLSRSLESDAVGWVSASVLFGLSHLTNLGFPNWRYVVLASIAGFFYGWTWRKTGSIFASALVHTLVNMAWHFLFLTL